MAGRRRQNNEERNERQLENLSKILGVLVLCLIMPLLFFNFCRGERSRGISAARESAANRENNEINTFEDFFIFAMASQTLDYEGHRVVLNTDLDLTDADIKAMLEKYGVTHLTVERRTDRLKERLMVKIIESKVLSMNRIL